ncbi:RimK family alpha-L-glutamate ligase [Flavobacterium sp. LAR06]|uniref:ATP-grasp domain-containing protein n=1 Tax=Flavobacterium sp. LAR06 TaxID=3064897 RepID=UPI0035C19D9F
MENVLFPSVLIISNRYDFSSDFIAVELDNQKISYLRINRDELKDYIIEFNPLIPVIKGSFKDISFCISSETLKSIYFRAPTFLRDIFQDDISEEEQLIRSQWTAFVRSLSVFENIIWLNNPIDIYKAEIKPHQLYIANKIGFKVPSTLISNKTLKIDYEYTAIKSIDTAIINLGEHEGFVYTELYKTAEIVEQKYSSPFFIQQGLIPKLDIRVTVVENEVIAVKIFQKNNSEIDIDWRRLKEELQYEIIELPENVKELCIQFLKEFNLKFGGIDLVFCNNEYYFIEINPTGEWSWLQQNTGFKFDNVIVNALNK